MGWADPSSTGCVVPSSTVAVVWMAAPSMVVASTRDWSKVAASGCGGGILLCWEVCAFMQKQP